MVVLCRVVCSTRETKGVSVVKWEEIILKFKSVLICILLFGAIV